LHHAPPGQAIASAATLGDEAVRSEATSDALAEVQAEEETPK
jgi:hypothetical protein